MDNRGERDGSARVGGALAEDVVLLHASQAGVACLRTVHVPNAPAGGGARVGSRSVVLPLRMFCVAVMYVFTKCAKNAFVQPTPLSLPPKSGQKHT